MPSGRGVVRRTNEVDLGGLISASRYSTARTFAFLPYFCKTGKEDFFMNKKSILVRLSVIALLTAVTVILNRFGTIMTAEIKIGFSFVPIMLCGMLFGPIWGGACAGVGDILAAILVPLGPPHLGITATAILSGIIYGFIGIAAKNIKSYGMYIPLAAVLILTEKLVCTLLINSYWISGMTGNPYLVQLSVRIPQAVILILPELVLAFVSKKYIVPALKKVTSGKL